MFILCKTAIHTKDSSEDFLFFTCFVLSSERCWIFCMGKYHMSKEYPQWCSEDLETTPLEAGINSRGATPTFSSTQIPGKFA